MRPFSIHSPPPWPKRFPPGIDFGRILDLGTGTGLLARRLAFPNSRVIGIDIVSEMIRAARSDEAGPALSYVQADIERMPFGDDCFDLAASSFGLGTTHPRQAFREIRRLLRPGGLLVFQEWAALDELSADCDEILATFAPAHLLEAIDTLTVPYQSWSDRLQDIEDYREMLISAGFGDVRVDETVVEITVGDPDRFIRFKLAWAPHQLVWNALDEMQRGALVSTLCAALQGRQDADGILRWRPSLFRVTAALPS